MRETRIYTQLPLQIGAEFELDSASAHHLLQVLRMKPGATLTLFNGDGRDYYGFMIESGRRSIKVAISDRSGEEQPPTLSINLGLGVSKGERMDFAIQKSVELGVTGITPLLTEHSVIRLSAQRRENRQEHWKRVATAACEQSGRRRLPSIVDILGLHEWLKITHQSDSTSLLLDHRAGTTLDRLGCAGATVNLLIGPEGGLSPQERELAHAAGFKAVSLGPRVLRTETAPLAAIAALQMLWGDFRGGD